MNTFTTAGGLQGIRPGDLLTISGTQHAIAGDGGLVRGSFQPATTYRVKKIEGTTEVEVGPYKSDAQVVRSLTILISAKFAFFGNALAIIGML